jgi:predicted dehydrogenase
LPQARLVAVCDVYLRKAEAQKQTAPDAKVFQDHRKLLETKDLDAVFIGTGDHWHVPISLDAINSGKDVYCEKPITLRLGEADPLKKAIAEKKRVFQSGMQQRSMAHYITARDEFVQAGKLGKVTFVRTWWHGSVRSFVRPVPPELVKQPAELDWKRFIEPVDKNRPYHAYQYNCFRAFFDFGGGQFTDLFTHWVDAAHMLVGEDRPYQASAVGGQYIPEYKNDGSGRTIPDTVSAQLNYPGGWVCTFDATMAAGIDSNGVELYGTKGRLYITRAGFEFTPTDSPNAQAAFLTPPDQRAERERWAAAQRARGSSQPEEPFSLQPRRDPNTVVVRAERGDSHLQNWLDCIKSRKTPNATIVDGIRSAAACHLCSVSYQQGRRLQYDPETERLVG